MNICIHTVTNCHPTAIEFLSLARDTLPSRLHVGGLFSLTEICLRCQHEQLILVLLFKLWLGLLES